MAKFQLEHGPTADVPVPEEYRRTWAELVDAIGMHAAEAYRATGKDLPSDPLISTQLGPYGRLIFHFDIEGLYECWKTIFAQPVSFSQFGELSTFTPPSSKYARDIHRYTWYNMLTPTPVNPIPAEVKDFFAKSDGFIVNIESIHPTVYVESECLRLTTELYCHYYIDVLFPKDGSTPVPPRGSGLVVEHNNVAGRRHCRYCHSLGHWRCECTVAPPCYHCQSQAHSPHQCPTRRKI